MVLTIYNLKSRFQDLLRPVCRAMAVGGITANHVTIAALLFSCAWGGLFAAFAPARWVLFGTPVVLLVRMALNAIDGMLAREHHMKSALGAVLNEMGDVVADAAIYLPFVRLAPGLVFFVGLAVLLGVVSEMAGVVAVQIGAGRRYDGPMGKSDRAFVFGSLAFAAGCGLRMDPWAKWVLSAVILLLVVTTVNRLRSALREARAP